MYSLDALQRLSLKRSRPIYWVRRRAGIVYSVLCTQHTVYRQPLALTAKPLRTARDEKGPSCSEISVDFVQRGGCGSQRAGPNCTFNFQGPWLRRSPRPSFGCSRGFGGQSHAPLLGNWVQRLRPWQGNPTLRTGRPHKALSGERFAPHGPPTW